jgi:hypothetical protein
MLPSLAQVSTVHCIIACLIVPAATKRRGIACQLFTIHTCSASLHQPLHMFLSVYLHVQLFPPSARGAQARVCVSCVYVYVASQPGRSCLCVCVSCVYQEEVPLLLTTYQVRYLQQDCGIAGGWFPEWGRCQVPRPQRVCSPSTVCMCDWYSVLGLLLWGDGDAVCVLCCAIWHVTAGTRSCRRSLAGWPDAVLDANLVACLRHQENMLQLPYPAPTHPHEAATQPIHMKQQQHSQPGHNSTSMANWTELQLAGCRLHQAQGRMPARLLSSTIPHTQQHQITQNHMQQSSQPNLRTALSDRQQDTHCRCNCRLNKPAQLTCSNWQVATFCSLAG